MTKTRIMLADDHELVRKGFRALLESQPDFSVVGEAADGRSAIESAKVLQPDILILDLMMLGLNGLDVIPEVARYAPRTRVLVLAMYAEEGYAVKTMKAMKGGATGYVTKGTNAADLFRAVREVAAGHRYLSPPLSDQVIRGYSFTDRYDALTTREREVLCLTAEACTASEIGRCLHISPRTVETHRSHIMQKLSLHTQAELIRFVVRKGILQ